MPWTNTKLLCIALTALVAYVLGNTFFIVLPVAGLAYVLWMKEYTALTALMGAALMATSISFSLRNFSCPGKLLILS
jgi:chromate transporter